MLTMNLNPPEHHYTDKEVALFISQTFACVCGTMFCTGNMHINVCECMCAIVFQSVCISLCVHQSVCASVRLYVLSCEMSSFQRAHFCARHRRCSWHRHDCCWKRVQVGSLTESPGSLHTGDIKAACPSAVSPIHNGWTAPIEKYRNNMK